MKTIPYMTKKSLMNTNIKQSHANKSISNTMFKNTSYRSKFKMEHLAILLVLIMLTFAVISIYTDKKSTSAFNVIDQKPELISTYNVTAPSIAPSHSDQTKSPSINEQGQFDELPPPMMPVEDLSPISAIQLLEPSDNLEADPSNDPSTIIELSSRSNPNASESGQLEVLSQEPTSSIEDSIIKILTTEQAESDGKSSTSEEISSVEKSPSTEQEKTSQNSTSKDSTPAQNTSSIVVVVDPGHGGIDPGTCSLYKEGLYEKDINLDIGLRLKKMLEDAGISVIMTRETDTLVYKSKTYNYNENILERPRIANRNNATLFISIHVNAFDTKISGGDKYNGTEVYYTNKTHGEYTNKQFAEMMGNAIDIKTDTKYNGIRNKSLGVLRLSNMPALLIETAYLTNKEDHKLLETDEFRTNITEGIYDGAIKILQTIGSL